MNPHDFGGEMAAFAVLVIIALAAMWWTRNEGKKK